MLNLVTDSGQIFAIRKDGQLKMTFRDFAGGWGEGQYGRFEPYEFGIAYKQGGGASASSKDNRLELYLGESDTSAAELSVRHNGNGTGAIIQARNNDDTDGIFLDFRNSAAPYVRWGNAGPYLIKHDSQTLIIRNDDNQTQSQRLWIASKFTPGGVREYVSIGVETPNRFCLRTGGYGGGSQRPLDIDGQTIQFQIGGTPQWIVDNDGLLKAGGTTSSYPAIKRVSASIEIRLANDSGLAPIKASIISTGSSTVSALPSAGTVGIGARAFVTDSTSATFGSAVSGGGTNKVPVWSDGVGWYVG